MKLISLSNTCLTEVLKVNNNIRHEITSDVDAHRNMNHSATDGLIDLCLLSLLLMSFIVISPDAVTLSYY